MTNGTLKSIQNDFKRIAYSYADALCELFELNKEEGWWIGDDIGGVYCNGDMYCITFDEIRYIVDNGISKDEFLEYEEYVSFCLEFNLSAPNLQSWVYGCHLHSKETIQYLRKLKREFDIANNAFTQAKNKL